MARKKNDTDVDELAGTVEGLSRDHFEREKAAYEERTGQKVDYYFALPTTRTPIDPEPVEESTPAETAEAETPTETNQSEGDN